MENLISAIIDLQKILEDVGIPSALMDGGTVEVYSTLVNTATFVGNHSTLR